MLKGRVMRKLAIVLWGASIPIVLFLLMNDLTELYQTGCYNLGLVMSGLSCDSEIKVGIWLLIFWALATYVLALFWIAPYFVFLSPYRQSLLFLIALVFIVSRYVRIQILRQAKRLFYTELRKEFPSSNNLDGKGRRIYTNHSDALKMVRFSPYGVDAWEWGYESLDGSAGVILRLFAISVPAPDFSSNAPRLLKNYQDWLYLQLGDFERDVHNAKPGAPYYRGLVNDVHGHKIYDIETLETWLDDRREQVLRGTYGH